MTAFGHGDGEARKRVGSVFGGARGNCREADVPTGVAVSLALVHRQIAVRRPDGIFYPSVLERTAHVVVAKELNPHPRVLDMHRVKDLFEAIDDPILGELSLGISKLSRGPTVAEQRALSGPLSDLLRRDSEEFSCLGRGMSSSCPLQQVAACALQAVGGFLVRWGDAGLQPVLDAWIPLPRVGSRSPGTAGVC